MDNTKIVGGMLFAAFTAATPSASAVITAPTVVNFEQPGQTKYSGVDNLVGTVPAGWYTCASGTGGNSCYVQNGISIGVAYDPTDSANHYHRNSDVQNDGGDQGSGYTLQQLGNYSVGTFSDANGIYIRATDNSAFSLTSMVFDAMFTPSDPATNPIYGSNPTVDQFGILEPENSTYDSNGNFVYDPSVQPASTDNWEILGFSDALNPTVAQDTEGNYTTIDPQTGEPMTNLLPEVNGNGPVYSDLVAEQFVPNGFNGVLQLNSDFQNVSAIWIFKEGYPETPTNGIAFRAYIDNLQFGAAVTAVPVPGAAWLFGSGLVGLLSYGRKKAGLAES